MLKANTVPPLCLHRQHCATQGTALLIGRQVLDLRRQPSGVASGSGFLLANSSKDLSQDLGDVLYSLMAQEALINVRLVVDIFSDHRLVILMSRTRSRLLCEDYRSLEALQYIARC